MYGYGKTSCKKKGGMLMRTVIRYIGESEEKEMSLFAFLNNREDGDNDRQRSRMKRILKLAMENELTQRQKDCINMKFYSGMKVCEIADRLNIKTATVYKHIRKGIEAMKHCSIYL